MHLLRKSSGVITIDLIGKRWAILEAQLSNKPIVGLFPVRLSQRGGDNKESARLVYCTKICFAIWMMHSLLACHQNRPGKFKM